MRQRFYVAVVAILVIGTVGLSLPALGRMIHLGVWGDKEQGIRPDLLKVGLFTSTAEGRIARSADRVRGASKRAGFHPSAFEVRETNSLYALFWARRETHIAGYLWGGGMVIVDHNALSKFNDSEMDCVLAHEVGHILQFDEGYPATLEGPTELQQLTMEVNADRRAATICGEENWELLFERHIGTRAVIAK